MKQFVRVILLASLTSSSLVFTACSDKKSDPAPAVTTGTVNGQITPAASVTTVTATSSTNVAVTATVTAAGAYTFSGLSAGTYALTFTPATGFAAPAPQSITVTAGGTTTATPVTTTAAAATGSGTWTVGGVSSTATLVLGNYLFNNFSITLANATGSSVVMNMDGFNGVPAAFTLGGFANSSQVIYGTATAGVAQQWTTASLTAGSSGTITVTAVGTNPRRATGTFSCTAMPATSASTGSKVITGTFTNIPY